MTQREEFEAWAVVAGWPIEKQDAHYVFDTTFAASTAWEAARAAQPVQPSQAREPVFWWDGDTESLQDCLNYKRTDTYKYPLYREPPDTEAKDAALRAALWDAKRYRYLRDNCVIQNRASTDGPAYKELRFHGKIYPDWRFAIDHIGLNAAVDVAIEQIEALGIASKGGKV